jgi:putative PLP-dependent aminotransferase (TIGR04422 family)
MIQLDYQWPSSFPTIFSYDKNLTNKSADIIIDRIEEFFSEYYGCGAYLMPSGRSSISLLMRYLEFDRNKTVFITKWSSNCLYSCIGPYSNISTDLVDPDLILANHKWGYKVNLPEEYSSKIIIEDSVDTIHSEVSSLFQNNGLAEIISLPKIIGSFSGGLIVTKDTDLASYIKSQQQSNIELGCIQSERKYKSSKNVAHSALIWHYFEHINTSLDMNALRDIESNLHNFFNNANIISNRREMVLDKFVNLSFDSDRLGPVVVFPLSQFSLIDNNTDIMVRRFSHSSPLHNDTYEESYILPMHFMITDEYFKLLLDLIVER